MLARDTEGQDEDIPLPVDLDALYTQNKVAYKAFIYIFLRNSPMIRLVRLANFWTVVGIWGSVALVGSLGYPAWTLYVIGIAGGLFVDTLSTKLATWLWLRAVDRKAEEDKNGVGE